MSEKKHIMTYEGVKKLEDELEYLKTVKRKEITEKIKVALGYGDLSENSEYDEAKNEQAFTEGRIIQLENMLKNAVVVDESEISTDIVTVGSIVKVKMCIRDRCWTWWRSWWKRTNIKPITSWDGRFWS